MDLNAEDFNKSQLENICSDFRDVYKSFNKNLVLEKMRRGYEIDASFHLKMPNELRYVVLKH